MLFFLFGGELMANEQNLIPGGHKLTQEEQSKGGKASGEARRNKKLLRDCIDYLLEREDKATIGVDGSPMSGAEQLAYNLFIKALTETDTGKAAKAFEVLRDTAGQKPVEKVQATQTVVDMSAFSTEEIKAMLDEEV
jgi:hypothetical protein